MGLGDNNQPQREFQSRVNQSAYGLPYIVVMGTGQVQQQILWIDGFNSTPAPQGKGSSGGGKGGGKSGQELYSADVVVALCNGPIQGVGDVWSGQSWLGNIHASESYTIAGPSYTYIPTNATNLILDAGVGVQNTYSASYNDIGAPSATVLSGMDTASLTKVAYGTTLTTGLYSINPTGNVYNFSSADVGRTVTTNYSWLVTNINRQENDIVPAGKTISVSGVGAGSTVNGDNGVIYTNTDVAFTKVNGTPSVTGTYSVTGNNPAVYSFATGDISALVTINFSVNDPNAISPGQATSLNFTLNSGTMGQSPFSFLTASYPDAAFGYTGIALGLYAPMDMGMGDQVQENRFEVVTYDIYGQGIQDCNPVQCIYKVLTNAQWGLGVGPVPFPTAAIDNGSSGTWGGAPATPGARQVNSTAWNWFAAQNFFITPVLDSQDTAASVISKWIEAGMCAAFVSEGLLKLVPYGDTSAAANGVTWTAPSVYVVALDDTCFGEPKEGEDPVKIARISTADAWNHVQIQWDNRLNQYAPEITHETDQGLINRWGERKEDPQQYDFLHAVNAATFAGNMRIKHNGYDRNTFEFPLPYTYSYLEPMDVITISTTSIWGAGLNNVNLGVTNVPIRITKIVDDPIKGLQITAESYVFGAHQPTIYNKQLNTSEQPANAYADPGNSEVVMFEATNRLTGYDGDEIWIGILGTSANWGSCNIWVSETSGGDYICVGSVKGPARLGTLHSSLASGSDPDTTHTLIVDLVENCGAFEAGTTTDADHNNTMCFVDGEIISYSALTYSGQNQITMGVQGSPASGYMRRGQLGSTIASHSSGGLFLRLDASIFKYQYDPSQRGQARYFKFQSVNNFGLMAQSLASLTPTSFVLPGVNQGSVDAESGLVFEQALGTNASYRPTTNPLTSIDNGTAPEVDIASFTMQVANTSVSYNSGSVTGTTGDYGQTAFIYFSDPYLTGGTVTYNLSMTRETSLAGGTNFFLGSIQLPNSGGGLTIGNNDGGTGGQYTRTSRILASTATTTGTWTNPNNAIDNDTSTYATGTATSGGGATLVLSAYPQFTSSFTTDTLTVVDRVTAIAGGAPYLVEYSTNAGGGWNTLRSTTSTDASIITTTQTLASTVNSAQIQVRFTLPGASGTVSTTPLYAGLGADGGGAQAWSTPTNAEGSGSTPTTSTVTGSGAYATTNYLKLTDYGFGLTSGDTVVGIAVTISHSSNSKSDSDYSMDVYDNVVSLIKGGTIVTGAGSNLGNSSSDWPTTQGSQSYGGSTSLWGTTWLYSDINNSGFGVAISAALSNDIHSGYENATGRVYWAQITIYYTSGAGSSCTAQIYDASQVVTL